MAAQILGIFIVCMPTMAASASFSSAQYTVELRAETGARRRAIPAAEPTLCSNNEDTP
jgi:hypothetical protein